MPRNTRTTPEPEGPDDYRPMPMPVIHKPRAAEPWREVHREKGKRHRVTVTWDLDRATAHALACLGVTS